MKKAMALLLSVTCLTLTGCSDAELVKAVEQDYEGRITDLETENAKLKAENEKLKERLGIDVENETTERRRRSDITTTVEVTTQAVVQPVTQPVTQPTPVPAQQTSSTTLGMQNALKSAMNYLSFSGFSYTGLIEQLKYEGYSDAEATYAADNCGANWNEQAARSARNYLDFSSFSRQELIEQLKYEGFTQSQAEYGVSAVGY